MKYQVITKSKSGGYDKKESYDNLISAEKKISKTYKNKNTEIIPIPEDINIGFQFKTVNGYYGEIVKETEYCWIVQRQNGRESEFLKSDIEDKFIRRVFVA